MSIIDSGRYRLRKDWASASIPSLVDIDEHVSDEVENSLNITTPLPPPKPPRRSSLALGLFSSKGDKSQKRRSSIAVFLRRDSNKNTTKDSYESAVKHEKSDGSNTPASPEISFSSAEHVRASSPNEPGKVTYFDDGSSLRPIVKGINNTYDSPVDKERNRRRRSSLQAKLERHRRKNNDISQLSIDNSLPSGSQSDLTNGSMGGSAIGASSGDLSGGDIDPHHSAYFPRQKRHSWWNIFVPDNLKTRSKSRSVDHGLAAPFDLDSLRSKVEGRFESVDRLTNERKKSSLPTIPTKSYTVGNRDTLTSVAARFDTTPSELTHLNRLNSSFIYPGQQLLVPDKSAAKNDSVSGSATGIDEKGSDASISGKSSPIDRKLSTTDEQNDENDILEGLRPGSPKPGHIERVDSAKSTDNAQAEANKSDDPVITQRFLKINVRHITDGQGVVGGVLLVTPNAVMFDPNVSDPLVIEHGPESYGVIAPMELVVNAAIFHDIAHMRVSGGVNTEQNENAEIYYPQAVLEAKQAKEAKERGDESVDGARKQSATGGSMETCDDQESLCSNTGEREQKDAEKGVEAKEESAKTDDEVNTKANKTEDDADANDLKKTLNLTDTRTTLEERRKSLLDHHWAIPSKDRSSEDEGDNESQTTIDSGARGQDPHSATSSISGIGAASGALHLPGGLAPADLEHLEELAKQSCYDSGIDIREPIANLQPIPKKTVYSDADIVLSSDWVPPKTISPTLMSESPPRSSVLSAQSLDAGTAGGRKKTTSVSFSVDDNNSEQQAAAAVAASAAAAAAQGDKNTEKKNKMLKRLSYPLAWVEGLTGEAGGPPGTGGSLGKSADSESAPNTGDSNQSVFSKVFSRRSSIGTFMRPQSSEGTASTTKLKDVKQQPKLDYRSMVSVDDKPELFISVDKLIPRPARACPDPPLYLRLRMGKPIGKAIPLPTSVMSYGKNKLRPEYWFSVPKNRVDELYRFINTWVQHLYGELNEEQIKARGFELIQDDTEWTKSGSGKSGRSGSQENEEISDLTRESWEVLSMSTDDYRKASLFATGSFDLDFPIPDLIGTTEILTEEHREKLCGHLPARAEGYSWSLIFSTSQHGFSLNSLYRKMQKLESPILIVIQDTDNNVFGALTSCSLHVSDHFYGTGESLLYKFNPSFKVFHWTGENLYFIKGNMESLSIGAGDGRFGLWLDGDLNQGRSQSCSTYGNEPLAPQEDFVIKTLECWAFV
ncbi:oxidation resistance protein 1 isoform X21 [Bactrocera neohumeralis]|uniref:oxidation resistance protein 1 isoform X18 n=1 Tax=Bactrocera tryoni TaxID=59916 RepID=UPI001A964CF2|nr:oxidation resistance protein 1 isoform X18 [Bactrocera tryoni]XP_050341612.1 oxidation resistance protein 1 isoform X21 [Bactrocera neohumeralis]